MDYFIWIEQSSISIWTRESLFAFPIALILHSIAMGFLVGAHIAIDLRILGLAAGIRMAALKAFMPVIGISAVVAVISGVWLLLAYPAKALTNPVFYAKLAFIILALLITAGCNRQLFQPALAQAAVPGRYKLYAGLSLLLWCAAITSGRFLAYTHSIEMVS